MTTPLEDFETIQTYAAAWTPNWMENPQCSDLRDAFSRASSIRAILEEDERRKSEIVAEMFSPITGEP